MNYKLIIHKGAEKDINKLHHTTGERVIEKIFQLQDNPRPYGYKKMTNYVSDRLPNAECYRIRVGDVRIIYTINDNILTIIIAQVKKRGDIY